MTYAANGFRENADARVLMINRNQTLAAKDGLPSVEPRGSSPTARSPGKRVAPRFRQRDLTKVMKAAKAAGVASFEMVDIDAGFIIRVLPDAGAEALADELDLELARLKERFGG